MFKTQNNEYNYIYVENYIYKKLKEAVEIYKSQTKNRSVLVIFIYISSVYILYVLLNVMLFETVSFLYWNVNGMLQAKTMINVLFSLTAIAQFAPRFCIVW